MTKHPNHPSRLATVIALLSLVLQPSAPIVSAARGDQAATKPATPPAADRSKTDSAGEASDGSGTSRRGTRAG